MAKMKLNLAATTQQNKINTGLALLFGSSEPAAKRLESVSLDALDAHPHQSRWSMNEDELNWLTNNIAQVGVLEPVNVMQKPDGRYLLLAGHRRCEAARRAGLTEIPALIEPYNEARADIIFCATNLGQRQHLRPSEKAYAYLDLENAVGNTGKTTAAIAELTGDNVRMIQRYKRLTALVPELLARVDDDRIPVYAGEALASLNAEEQASLVNVLEENEIKKVSLKQAKELQAAAANATDDLSPDEILAVFCPPPYPDWLAGMVKKFLDWHKLTPHTVSAEWLKENLGRHQAGGGNIDLDFAISLKGIVFTHHSQRVEMTWARFVAYCRSLSPADEKPITVYRSEIAQYIPSEADETAAMQVIIEALRFWQQRNTPQ